MLKSVCGNGMGLGRSCEKQPFSIITVRNQNKYDVPLLSQCTVAFDGLLYSIWPSDVWVAPLGSVCIRPHHQLCTFSTVQRYGTPLARLNQIVNEIVYAPYVTLFPWFHCVKFTSPCIQRVCNVTVYLPIHYFVQYWYSKPFAHQCKTTVYDSLHIVIHSLGSWPKLLNARFKVKKLHIFEIIIRIN